MARPIKEGLQYFPLDVDIDQDDKILIIEAVHGIEGFGVLIKLLMKIYKEGYFYKWSRREQLIFSKRVNVDINSVEGIVSDSLKEGVFDKRVFERYEVLTSKGIQTRYLDAITRRKVVYFEKRYLLIDPLKHLGNNAKLEIRILDENTHEEEVSGVNVDINVKLPVVNSNISTQSKVKKSIEEIKETITTAEPQEKTIKLDDDFAKVAQFYSSNLGNLVPHVGEELGRLVDNHPGELVVEALKISVENNAKNKMKYTERILNSWKENLLHTLDAVKADEKRRGNFTSSKKDEKVPDWFYKQKTDRESSNFEQEELSAEAKEQKRELLKNLGMEDQENN